MFLHNTDTLNLCIFVCIISTFLQFRFGACVCVFHQEEEKLVATSKQPTTVQALVLAGIFNERWGHFPAVAVVTTPGILSQKWSFPNPNQVFFLPKPQQSSTTELSQHKAENSNVKKQSLNVKKFQHVHGKETCNGNVYSADWVEATAQA